MSVGSAATAGQKRPAPMVDPEPGTAPEPAMSTTCKSGARPVDIPYNPNTTYKHDGRQSSGHWVGSPDRFLPFEEARSLMLQQNLTSTADWQVRCLQPLPYTTWPLPAGHHALHEMLQGAGQGCTAATQGPQDCKPSTLNFHILPLV